jgi:predicted carbohydrate-binding protein with CBM5 and CBM33 domain
MKHFNYITKPNYIKENPLYKSDFLTYDFYEINKTPKQQT